MSAVARSSGRSFSERLVDFLDVVSCRRVDDGPEREAIYRLRYDAYVREGAISRNFTRRFADPFDDAANVWIFGLYIEDRLASSIRVHVASPECPESPGLSVFPDLLVPEIEQGRTIVDPTRFVADHVIARHHPELPYATVRLGFIASEYFGADLGLATVRAEHQAFYKRLFGLNPLCEPRDYPSLAKPISLMAIHYPTVKERIIARYPFLSSTPFERDMLFDRMAGLEADPIATEPAFEPSILPAGEAAIAYQMA